MHNKQLLLAHRGYSAIAPENTKLAFAAAVDFGFDGFELDVHQTKDNELVIIHDETTLRTAKTNKTVEKTDLKSLKIDDHSAFFPISVPKQEIMTLKEFLDKFLDLVELINIEVKTDLTHYVGIEKRIINLLDKYPSAKEKIILSSFNFKSLEIIHDLNPEYKLGFLWWTHTQFKNIPTKRIKEVCQYLHPWTQVYDENKTEYKKLKLPFCLWTLKSVKKYKKYLKDKSVIAQISNYKY